jgi:hypothetical protein
MRRGRIAFAAMADHGLADELLAMVEIPKGSRDKADHDARRN